jgi:hypothetical protein
LSVVGRTPGIVSLSHWGTVRREGNGRRRNERIIQACGIFCRKPARSPVLCGVNMTPMWKQAAGLGLTGGFANVAEMLRRLITSVRSKQTVLAQAAGPHGNADHNKNPALRRG